MGNLTLFHPYKWSYYLTYYWVPGSTFVQRWIKTPPEVGTIDSSSEGSWLQGGMEHNGMSKILCRAQNGESSTVVSIHPRKFLLKHMSEWLFHALSYYLFLYGFGSRFQFESGELFPKPVGAEGKV